MNNSLESIPLSIINEGKENFTPFVFYNDFLPKIRKTLISLNKKQAKISFDLTQVRKINPLVLPNFLIVGKILNNFLGYPIEIIFNRNNVEVIKFLDSIGFFRLLESENIFSFDREFVAEYSASKVGNIGILLCIPFQKMSSTEIIRSVLNNNHKIAAFLEHFDDHNLAETFAYSVGELIHNCMVHGKSCVFFSVYGGPIMGLHCSVSDSGLGYLKRILEKPDDLTIFTKKELEINDKYSNLRAIIEAVFKRFDKQTYGLTSVIRSIANIGGTTRIHTQNTQIIFSSKNKFLSNNLDSKDEGRLLYESLLQTENSIKSLQSSSLRIRETILTGAHVEFEIPATKYYTRGDQ